MGAHAFPDEPDHCAGYRRAMPRALPRIFGVDARWNMPGARHRRALGAGADFPGAAHYVLTYHLSGGAAHRLDGPRRWPVAQTGAISLQTPGSGGRFASVGVITYAHLYFQQSLLCEIADEAALSPRAEPEDFFGMQDASWALDIEAYLRRAVNDDDPPSQLEMDCRAYILGFGLLRAVGRRSGTEHCVLPAPARADMRRVVDLIEDRIAEPLPLAELAAAASLSPFHFARVFKSSIGESPARYIRQRRVARATALITSGDLPLYEVALRTGFSSQSQMTTAVRETTGATPHALRREAR